MTQATPGSSNVSTLDDRRGPDIRDSEMMAHLLDHLEKGTDIGHYGRLVFTIVAHHFMDRGDIVSLLSRQPDVSEEDARGLLAQVEARDYNPPKREKILAWQSEQGFPIIPNSDDPDSGNLYRDLKFPDHVYDSIGEYYEDKAEAK